MYNQFDEEPDENEFEDEDGIINTGVRVAKSTGYGVNLDAPLRQPKEEKEMKKSTGPRVKRVQ
jgi:hypothetical protein